MRRMREDHLHRNYSDVNERPIRCRAKLIQPKAGMAARLAMIPSAYNGTSCPATAANLLTSVNSLNKKIIKNLLPGAVEHPATLISRQHSLSAENHRNGSSETINRHQEMAWNAEIQ